MAFKIKESKEDKNTYFSLVEADGEIILIGETENEGRWNIVKITTKGYLYKYSSIAYELNLKLNNDKRIVETTADDL